MYLHFSNIVTTMVSHVRAIAIVRWLVMSDTFADSMTEYVFTILSMYSFGIFKISSCSQS